MPIPGKSVTDVLNLDRGTDIRLPTTALLGISSADRYARSSTYTSQPVGEWDAGVTYAIGDIVTQNDLFYVSLVNANVNNDPSLTLAVDWDYTEPPEAFVSRPTTQTPYNFSLYSRQAFMNGFFRTVALSEIVFTWSLPTITARNNKIGLRYRANFSSPTQQAVITVPENWYTPTTLASMLQGLIRTATGITAFTMTMSASPDTGVMTGNTNGSEQWCFVPCNVATQGTGTAPETKTQPDRIQLYDMLNWKANTGNTTTGPNAYVLSSVQTSGIITLLTTKFVDIVSSRITSQQSVRDGDTGRFPRDVVARVYLQGVADQLNPENLGSQPFVVYKNYTQPKIIQWDPTVPIAQLSFELYDDQGYALSTLDGSTVNQQYNDLNAIDWNATLLCSEI